MSGPLHRLKHGRGSSREGLREYALVTAFLVLAAAGALILFGDQLSAALGLR